MNIDQVDSQTEGCASMRNAISYVQNDDVRTDAQRWLMDATITDVTVSEMGSSNPHWFANAIGTDGTVRRVFIKDNSQFGTSYAEVLAYLVAVKCEFKALVVPACVYRRVEALANRWVVVAECVDGTEVAQTTNYLDVDAHAELHMLDAIIGNSDRHAHNAMVDALGVLYAIDNAGGWRIQTLDDVDDLDVSEYVSTRNNRNACPLCSWESEANFTCGGCCRYCNEGRTNENYVSDDDDDSVYCEVCELWCEHTADYHSNDDDVTNEELDSSSECHE